MVKGIQDKEGATARNAIYEKLILEHTCPEILQPTTGKEFINDLLPFVCVEHNIEKNVIKCPNLVE